MEGACRRAERLGQPTVAAYEPRTVVSDLLGWGGAADRGCRFFVEVGPVSRWPIWMYWEDPPGRGRPPYLDLCLESIRRQSSGLDVRVVSRDGLVDLLPDLP